MKTLSDTGILPPKKTIFSEVVPIMEDDNKVGEFNRVMNQEDIRYNETIDEVGAIPISKVLEKVELSQNLILQFVAQGWCSNKRFFMLIDVDLAFEIARIFAAHWRECTT